MCVSQGGGGCLCVVCSSLPFGSINKAARRRKNSPFTPSFLSFSPSLLFTAGTSCNCKNFKVSQPRCLVRRPPTPPAPPLATKQPPSSPLFPHALPHFPPPFEKIHTGPITGYGQKGRERERERERGREGEKEGGGRIDSFQFGPRIIITGVSLACIASRFFLYDKMTRLSS